MPDTELLVGTKKGLFVLRGDPSRGEPFDVATRAFAGDVVEFAMRDPRTGRYFASVTSGFYGPRVFFIDGDPTGEWTMSEGPRDPRGDRDVARTHLDDQAGRGAGRSGRASPTAALFESRDDGVTWTLNDALWKERVAGDWQPGAGGLALHSICPWPGDPQRLAVGVSAAGVWITEDGGKSWRTGYSGMVPAYIPEDQTRGHERAVRPQHAPRAHAAGAAVHAVPRQRVPQRRRRLAAGTTSTKACPAGSGSRWRSIPPIPTAPS